MSEIPSHTEMPKFLVDDLVWHNRRQKFGKVLRVWRKIVEAPTYTYTYYDSYTVKFEDHYQNEKVTADDIQLVDRQEPFEAPAKESAVEPDLGN